MKRLSNILRSMDENTSTYVEMYNGTMRVVLPTGGIRSVILTIIRLITTVRLVC